MDARNGAYCYWVATGLAGLVAMAAVISYFLNAPRGMPVISTVALLIAATIWLCGWAGKHMIAGR